MKTCPDCAESVQDAARKCRFCGYRFDESEATATSEEEPPKSAVAAPAAATATSPWPFLVVAAGGLSLAIGGTAMCVLFATGIIVPLISTSAFGLAGLLLAIGWGVLLHRGQASPGAMVGGLLLTAAVVAALLIEGDGEGQQMLKGLLLTGGLLVCASLHLNTLEQLLLDGTRLTAWLAIVGFGSLLLVSSKKIDLPAALVVALSWLGHGGTLLFGVALTFGALSCWRDAKS